MTAIRTPHQAFVFYGGKGGVGKTTCAAARAVSEAAAGARVLVISTDPAHSLGDALAVRLSARPRTVRGVKPGMKSRGGTLDAVELDAPRAFARWMREHRGALGEILQHGTWLDSIDIDAMLDLPVPGVDELVGLVEIIRLASTARYDLTIVDTAPTGHTLRLLAAPEAVAAVADVLDALEQEQRYIRARFSRAAGPLRADAADRLIALLAQQAAEASGTMRDRQNTAFHWVTLPEPLSVAESEDAVAALTKSGLHIAEIIINRVLPPRGGAPPCPICDRRRVDERIAGTAVMKRIGCGRAVRVIFAELCEPRGIAALSRLAGHLVNGPDAPLAGEPSSISRHRSPVVSVSRRARAVAPESLAAVRGARLVLVGGKGGVGKTTVAATVALRLARAMPHRQVLLLSTDPAHSVGDVFETTVGDEPRQIPRAPKNLRVREIDAARSLEEKRASLETALAEVGSAVGFGTTPAGDRAARLMDLAPPGIDELFGLLSVVEAASARAVVVVDMAPTGHAIRLLEIPGAARSWIAALLGLLLKYRSIAPPGRLAEELADASRSIRELQALLFNGRRCRFLVVTRATQVSRVEAERLLKRLRNMGILVPALVINALTLSPGSCPRCRKTFEAEAREIHCLRRAAKRVAACAIIQTPLAAPAPRGVRTLDLWAGRWIA